MSKKEEPVEEEHSFGPFHWKDGKIAVTITGTVVHIQNEDVNVEGDNAGTTLTLNDDGKLIDVYCRQVTPRQARELLLNKRVEIKYSYQGCDDIAERWLGISNIRLLS